MSGHHPWPPPDKPTHHAQKACAEWLVACLGFGWRKDQLDALEKIWWKYHDNRGNFIPMGKP